MVYTYNESYTALTRKEILAHVTMWVNLEDTMLKEINQLEGQKHYHSTYMKVPKVAKFIDTEGRRMVSRDYREGEGNLLLNVQSFSYAKDSRDFVL